MAAIGQEAFDGKCSPTIFGHWGFILYGDTVAPSASEGQMFAGNLRSALFAATTLLVCASAGPLMAETLSMTCHELIQGAPDPDGNRYVLEGDILMNKASGLTGGSAILSSSKLAMLTPFNRYLHASTWSEHRVVGHKVYRTVYWKNRAGRTVRTFRDIFDFDAQTVQGDLAGPRDACHHNGR